MARATASSSSRSTWSATRSVRAVRVTGRRMSDVRDVLQRPHVDLGPRRAAADQQHRGARERGVGDRGDGVGHARARRSPWRPRAAPVSSAWACAMCTAAPSSRTSTMRMPSRATWSQIGWMWPPCRPNTRSMPAPGGSARSRRAGLLVGIEVVAASWLPRSFSSGSVACFASCALGRGAGSCRSRCAASLVADERAWSAGACSRRCGPCTSRSAPRSAVAPSCSTTTACTRSPHFASGRPITATSLTGGMRAEHGLDLGRIDVLAAGDDHVALAVDEVDVAVLVAAGHVADRAVVAAERLLASSPAASSSRRRCRGCRSRARRARRPGPRCRSRRAGGSGAEPTHSRPTEPSLVNCSSGWSIVTQPASVEP